jgi:hypothetical protein
MKLRIFNSLLIYLITGLLLSCGVYSFKGVNLHPDVKTLSIVPFQNNAGGGPSNQGQRFTEKMRDYFLRNTNLSVISGNTGDIKFSGNITGWTLTPVAPTASSGGNTVPLTSATRLTITISVSYVNTKETNLNFDRAFSFYSDFDNQSNTLSQVENQLIDRITDQIILDVFNQSVANW